MGDLEDLGNVSSFKLASTNNFYRWAPDGTAILTRDGSAYVVQQIGPGGATASYTVTTGTAQVEWANDSRHLSVLASGELRILPAFETLPIAAPVASGIKAVAWSPTRNEYFAIAADGHGLFVGGISGAPTQIVSTTAVISSAQWSPTGDRLSVVSNQSACSVVSRSQAPPSEGESVPSGYGTCTWFADGIRALTVGGGSLHIVSVGNLTNPTLVGPYSGVVVPSTTPNGDAFHWASAGDRLVSFAGNPSVGYPVGIGAAVWAPNGKFLVSGPTVVDLTLLPPVPHVGATGGKSHAFSADSSMLAYGLENTLRVRSIAAAQIGNEVIVYSDDAHSSANAADVSWSPDKDRLVFGFRTSSSGTPKLYVMRMQGTLGSAPLQVFLETGSSVIGEWQPM